MEQNCKRDINFMYLLEGAPAPDHATFARFRSLHFAPCSERIMAESTNCLHRIGEVSGEAIFIDGTKMEACANKYTFVWKKSTTKNLDRLLGRLASFVAECEEIYGIKIVHGTQVKVKHVKKLRKRLYALKEQEGIVFVHGIGRRKNPLQKSIEFLEECLDKFKGYTKRLHLCGERNSYSKTDHDATFMRMKEDAMKNGQLKPAYNLQYGVDSEYVAWIGIGPKPTDTTTLIPFVKEMESRLSFKYGKVVADAGYESEENYLFLEGNGQISFIKPANYEISKTRKFKNDISRIENMDYDEEKDCYVCKNGKVLSVANVRKEKTRTGYLRETTIYCCNDCKGCAEKAGCIKGNHSNKPLEERDKSLYVSKTFNRCRKEGLERIVSEEGRLLRTNRSIQAEGAFGVLKEDMGFRRFLSRGTQNVKAESTLLALAHNVKKLHNKIQAERTGSHLFPLKKRA
jgi:hypothetical protein